MEAIGVNVMRPAKLLLLALLVLVEVASASTALADGRVALVIGNSTYTQIGRLSNPENDAVDMAGALRRLGFEVITELDAGRVELTEALRAFTRRSAAADVSLVFYAGHGIEIDGVNYLVPVDARLERDVDVRYETVTLEDLLTSTLGASLRVVILDACRNNPLARSMQRTGASRSLSVGSFGNLDESLLGDETLVAYAAAAGTMAADGRGRNSPYTSALLSYLEEPLEILTLFRRVRARVLTSTNGQQRPHEYQSLVRDHYLGGAPALTSVTATAVEPAAAAGNLVTARAAPEFSGVNVLELDVVQLHQLAEQGDAGAQTQLGEQYEDGRRIARDYGVAVSWFRRAAQQGYAPAQAAIGRMYSFGRGVERDNRLAVSWYRFAAEQGHAPAQFDIGSAYANGRGVPRDYGEAVRWYRSAAEQGHAAAQHNLGTMYFNGEGVPQDDQTALLWIRRSAEQGEPYAQASLGYMYEEGRAVPRDRAVAASWYRLAADQGHENAQKRLNSLR